MSTGVVTSVTPRRGGGTLTAAVTATDVVLPVEDAADFAEDFTVPRWLVIGEETTPRRYVAVANDEDAPQSVTLAAPVGSYLGVAGGIESGLPITPWDPESAAADKRAVTYRAKVRLDDGGRVVPATIPHTTTTVAGIFALVGAHVRLEESPAGEVHIADILGRNATLTTEVESLTLRYPSGALAGVLGSLGSLGEVYADKSGVVLLLEDGSGFLNIFDKGLVNDLPWFNLVNVGYFLVDATTPGGIGVVLTAGQAKLILDRATGRLELEGDVVAEDGLTVNSRLDYLGAPTTSDAANLNFNFANGRFRVVTSSERFKDDVQPADLDPTLVRRIVPTTWLDKAELAEDPTTTERHIGVTAEHLHDLGLGIYVHYDDEDRPHAVKYDRLFTAVLTLAQHEADRADRLEQRLARIEALLGITPTTEGA